MELSVIICTLNRSKGLLVVLQSLLHQELKKNLSWEIIVVDNNSIDNTPDIVRQFSRNSDITVRYVKERTIGLSHARNRGIAEANGRYVMFLEDDEIADKNLVSEIYSTFGSYNCDCVGGRINLKFEDRIPPWITKDFWGFLGYLNHGDVPLVMDEKRYPYGGNMAFSKAIINKIGAFNVDLGRKGRQLFGGEEYDLFKRLLQSGGKGMYQPRALVQHRIDKTRLRKNYFRKLHYNAGLQRGLLNNTDYKRVVFGIPFFIFPQFLKSILIALKIFFSKGSDGTLRNEMIILNFIGFIKGSFLQRKK